MKWKNAERWKLFPHSRNFKPLYLFIHTVIVNSLGFFTRGLSQSVSDDKKNHLKLQKICNLSNLIATWQPDMHFLHGKSPKTCQQQQQYTKEKAWVEKSSIYDENFQLLYANPQHTHTISLTLHPCFLYLHHPKSSNSFITHSQTFHYTKPYQTIHTIGGECEQNISFSVCIYKHAMRCLKPKKKLLIVRDSKELEERCGS